ncbi:hypothetical protein GCM10009646_12950 [Streptomyces aureus]
MFGEPLPMPCAADGIPDASGLDAFEAACKAAKDQRVVLIVVERQGRLWAVKADALTAPQHTIPATVHDAVREAVDHAQALIARKIDQLRQAQQAGQLDPAWDPADVLALVNQIATTWAAQPEHSEAAAAHAADPTTTARRAAVVTTVERLFPRAH